MLSFLIVLALAGCATTPTPRKVSIGDSQEAVRARLGSPATERTLASGNRAWYYVTAPSGFYTWRVVFGSDDRVTEYAQVLTQENFNALPQGASRDMVLDRLGVRMPASRRATTCRTSGNNPATARAEGVRTVSLCTSARSADPSASTRLLASAPPLSCTSIVNPASCVAASLASARAKS